MHIILCVPDIGFANDYMMTIFMNIIFSKPVATATVQWSHVRHTKIHPGWRSNGLHLICSYRSYYMQCFQHNVGALINIGRRYKSRNHWDEKEEKVY